MELSSILFFAIFIETLVQSLLTKNPSRLVRKLIPYGTIVIGIALAIAYDLNILTMAGIESSYGIVDNVVTGAVVGRGSNFVNDVIGFIRSKK